jgi:uncharacterized small protein (DUF1192 family)
MRDEDEADLPRPKPSLVGRPPLDTLGVAELRAYIAALREEIARAEGEITKKEGHRGAADAFFRKPG